MAYYLTKRQEQVLDFIRAALAKNGYPPTLREIGNAFGIRSSNCVHEHLEALVRKGYLQREPLKPRAMRLVDPPAPIQRPPFLDSAQAPRE